MKNFIDPTLDTLHSDYYYNVLNTILEGPILERKYPEWKQIEIDKHGINDLAYTLQEITMEKITTKLGIPMLKFLLC